MDNTTFEGAPLTRRQAREIERRTGVRPIAQAADSAAAFRKHDTGRIERNELSALVSVLPTELVEQIAAPAEQAEATVRSLTVRAPRPAALVAQRRRRTAGSFAAAASVTALAAVGLTTVAGQGASVADGDHQANLLAATSTQLHDAAGQKQHAEQSDKAPQQAAAAPAAPAAETTSVQAFDASVVASAAEAVEETPAPTTTAGATDTGEATGAEGAATDAAATESAAPVSIPSTGSIQQDIIAYASSMLGSYGMDCTDFVQNALAHAGLTTPRLEGGPDFGISSFLQFGTQIPASEAQPGDIMISYGYHVAIYAGNGMAYHGGWNGDADDNVLTSFQGDPGFYDVIVRVG